MIWSVAKKPFLRWLWTSSAFSSVAILPCLATGSCCCLAGIYIPCWKWCSHLCRYEVNSLVCQSIMLWSSVFLVSWFLSASFKALCREKVCTRQSHEMLQSLLDPPFIFVAWACAINKWASSHPHPCAFHGAIRDSDMAVYFLAVNQNVWRGFFPSSFSCFK